MAIWRFLRETASRIPDAIAVSVGGIDVTYAELDDRVERVAAGLRFQGLGSADRVITVLGNSIEHLTLILGCFRASLVAVPLAPWSIPAIIRYSLRNSGARGIVAPTAVLQSIFEGNDELRPDVIITMGDANPPMPWIPFEIIEAGPGDAPDSPRERCDHLGMIVYTSGTTSRPKAVVHTQDRMARRVRTFAEEIRLNPADVAFVAQQICRPLPLLGQVAACLQVGGRIVMHDGLTRGFWDAYANGPPKTMVVTIPAVTTDLLAAPQASKVDHSHLRLWLSGGDAVSAALQATFHAITGRKIVEVCGMTEAGFFTINPIDHPPRVGSIGRPLKDVQFRIVDEHEHDVPTGATGELWLKTPDLMVGYWNDTAESFRVFRDGWMRTGDLARCDPDGYLWLAGRTSEVINRGGRKIAPPMVESCLEEHPTVERSVVVPVPDSVCGQAPYAFLLLHPGAEPPSVTEWQQWLATRLESSAIPVGFTVVSEWPLTYQGKLDRARLAWMATLGGTWI
ncbi:class I adenylate-forming enzyme family protein [Tuwongella immobilis]|uniref:AMP-dependent synthetase/ligase domain-containing protein n=1 Tax=Tuwongella immobilis TaxID=692036 RepID=A0A6C2YP16_9BACT|nr:class I adenylate-forming enzyme family protein [Tuwongella immobilis]VIP02939.1 long-chain fatty acid-- ligase : Acyl-CoA synthetase (AMP-forming)/AMP-acid ligase II OS=Desulfovibrio magneticus str. Maddingley MBC34 GN=B193_1945 PE=4 SV=1: AMP-binding: AMP-binding_C [Tuwongella immobilis]VTS02905.1 long-chain fatty acid-- ligase : Acyl-CoA synthetase (AMP-forming)/AMP-acid ligase II OS=Desulfovibrio magneticus str. Maddingley MBC34 GN=B193_1945 PE=4 SV=1: AMP-binding: AMP-binding_C [Tuwongell